MTERPSVVWNNDVRLVIADVDETIADVHVPAEPEIVAELSSFINDDKKLFMVTGGSLARVKDGITDLIDPSLRRNILIGHCSGSEVYGFEASGELRPAPFYSIYEETFTPEMKQTWRHLIGQLLEEFKLRPHPFTPKPEFWSKVGYHPLDIMFEDRGPQITCSLMNGRALTEEQLALFQQDIPLTQGRYDVRIPIMDRATQLLSDARLPITPRLAGNYSIDFAVRGVSKSTAIHKVLSSAEALQTINLSPEDVTDPKHLEIWGDKFSASDGGTDRHICEALPPEVRAIDFRQEDPAELPEGYNIVIWDGLHHLHHGLLEYLRLRPRKR